MAKYSLLIAEALGLDERRAGASTFVPDARCGKIAIRDAILLKPEKISARGTGGDGAAHGSRL